MKSGRGGDGARGGVVHISTELQLMRLRRWRHRRCRKQKYSSGRGRGAAAAVKGAGCCRLGKGNSSIHLIFRGWKAGTSARSTATTHFRTSTTATASSLLPFSFLSFVKLKFERYLKGIVTFRFDT